VDFGPEENALKIIAYLEEHGYLLPVTLTNRTNGHSEEEVPAEEAST
jgi:hypothetical protein